jgi:Disordered region of unknown function (DUF5315)
MAPPPRPASSSRAPSSIYSLKELSRPNTVKRTESRFDPTIPPRRISKDDPASHRDEFLPQDVDRYDRVWGDMAAKMGDLDRLAARPESNMRLVSEIHAKRVEQLREAQIRLAETWAGSESRLGQSQSSLLEKLANSASGCVLLLLYD